MIATSSDATSSDATSSDATSSDATASGREGRRAGWLGRIRPWCAGAGALVLLGALLAAGSCAWFGVASYDGDEEVAGLDASVEIVRDANAIPHIYAKSARDGAFAMGYIHAQDRLWQMELQRRIGQARLAAVVGEPAIETDRFLRTLGLYRVAERNFEILSDEAKAIYEAYAAGVNAYLETRSGLLPPEFLLLGHEPEPWRPADSLVWLKIMAWDLGDNFADELLRARLADKLDLAQMQDLWAQHPSDPAPGPHADIDFPLIVPLADAAAALGDALPGQEVSGFGSNGWVLSGEHTVSGKPLLANDPHLRLEVPSVWYLAHVSTPAFEVVGGTLPGLPFPLVGRTGSFAWGFTNTGPDVQDLFIERIDPDDPARYLAPEGSLPFEVRTEIIEVSGEDEPIELVVRETRHGPVVSDVLEESGEFLEDGHVLAFAWTALADDDTSGEALVQATAATNLDGFVEALRDLAVPQQTVVFADADGNIGFVAPGRVPIRASGQGHMPVPGWTGEHDWVDRVPFDALPGDYNPASGRIVSANNRMVADDYPHYITDDWTPPYRAMRIEALLDAKPKHDVASFAAIQQDLVSLPAARLVPVLLALAEPADEEARAAIALLREWDHTMSREGAAPLIYMAWLRELMHVLFADELGDVFEDYWRIRTEVIHRALGERPQWCDDVTTGAEEESCAQAVTRALDVALEFLAVAYGHDMEDWRWGEAHAVHMKSRILGEIPAVGSWFEVNMESGGEKETLKAGGFDVDDPERPFAQNHGAGYRAVYDLAAPERSVFIISTGQSGNPFSSHYEDYAEPWRDGHYLPMLTERARVEEDALGTLVLVPR